MKRGRLERRTRLSREGTPGRKNSLARTRFRTSPKKKSRRRQIRELEVLLKIYLLVRDVHCQMAYADFGACGGYLQVSHIKPKGTYPELRFHPLNVMLKCKRHHLYVWHRDVTASAAWFRSTFPDRAAELDRLVLSRGTGPRPKVNLAEVREHLESLGKAPSLPAEPRSAPIVGGEPGRPAPASTPERSPHGSVDTGSLPD